MECLSASPGSDDTKVSTQLTHLGSLVAMGHHISPTQKQQVIDNDVLSETCLTQRAIQILEITKPGSQPTSPAVTSSSSRLASVQEESLRKTTTRLEEWRHTIVASERERFWKTCIDM